MLRGIYERDVSAGKLPLWVEMVTLKKNIFCYFFEVFETLDTYCS